MTPTAVRWFLLGCVLGVLLLGCATPREASRVPPDWVLQGSRAFKDAGVRAFYGVGVVSGIRNQALARSVADQRARAEIARILKTYSTSLLRDYQAATTAGDFSRSSEEQHVEQTLKTFTEATLTGVRIVDRWVDPRDGTVYSLARLDLKTLKQTLEQVQELEEAVRNYVRQHAEEAFDRLEQELRRQ